MGQSDIEMGDADIYSYAPRVGNPVLYRNANHFYQHENNGRYERIGLNT